MALIIRKKSNFTFEHYFNGATVPYITNVFNINNGGNETFQLVDYRGANLQAVPINQIILYDDTTGGGAETFTTFAQLNTRLGELNYPPMRGENAIPSDFNLRVQEGEETPIQNVNKIIFSGATVTDNSDGSVTVTITGGGGSQNLQEVLNKSDRPVVPLLDGDTLESLNPHYNLLQCSSLTENATFIIPGQYIPQDPNYEGGDQAELKILNDSDFTITLTPDDDVTINGTNDSYTIPKNAVAILKCLNTFTWSLTFQYAEINSSGFSWIVVSANQTAQNDKFYCVVANSTFTDPTPVEGKGYVVFVRNGTATVGGTGYAVGRIIYRFYHSGAWSNRVYVDETIIGSATQTALDLKENLSNKVTDITGATGTYPDTPTVKNYVDLQESAFGVKNRYVSVLTIQSIVTNANISTSAANTNGRVAFIPFRVGEDINIKNIGVLQNAENDGASSTLTFYVYDDSNDGLPGIKLHQVISPTGIFIGAQKPIDLSVDWNLPRGNYWIGIHPRGLNTAGSNLTFVGGNIAWHSVLDTALTYSNNRNSFLNITNQSADLGDNPILTISTSATVSLPQIFIKS